MRKPRRQSVKRVIGRSTVAGPVICRGQPMFRGTRILVGAGIAWETIVEEWRGDVHVDAISEAVALANRTDLETRVRAVLDVRQQRGRLGVFAFALTGAAAILIAMTLSPVRMAFALQNQTRQASVFEVASVRPNPDHGPPGDVPVNADKSLGHFAMRDRPLRYIIEWAYDLKDYQIAGPPWIEADERYDITAHAPGPATEDKMRIMLQALLAERFQMKSHFEKRKLDAYALVPGKGEPKLKKADPNSALNVGSLVKGKLHFPNSPLSRVTFLLTRRMDRPALDLTGLSGSFDYAVDLSGLGYKNNSSGYDGDGPSVFQAIQQDMGLKLEPGKYPVDVLVIDSVNKVPSRN